MKHTTRRKGAPIAALTLLSSACAAATLAFKPMAAVFVLLGMAFSIAGFILAARSRPGAIHGGRTWIVAGLVAVFAAVVGGYIVGLMAR